MDAIGAISGVLAIVTAALQVSRAISNLISEIKDAPQSIQRLSQELRDLEFIFAQIDQTNVKNGEPIYSAAVEMSLKSCRDELGKLRELLESLVPKSIKDGIHQRTFYGIKKFFKDGDIGDAINSLQSRKLSICLALMTNLTSTKAGYVSGSKNVQEMLLEQNGSDDMHPPSYELVRRVTTFDPDRKIPGGGAGLDLGEMAQSPAKLLEKTISQTIERTMEKIQGEFLRKPNMRIEDLLSLGPIETRQLWATNLQSIREFRAADLERKREVFLQSLPSPDYHGDKIKAKNAQDGTCEWIFDHPQYLAWHEDEGSSILHAMGKPGSGKTVLARHILETLQGADSTQLLYCFCNNRDNPNQTAPDILGAIIHQFLSDRKSLFPLLINKRQGIFEQFYRSAPSSWSLESLWDIFLVLIDSAQLDVVYCIVDALDECEAESVSDLLSLISEAAISSKNFPGGVARVKFFLTSRPFERLEVELDQKIVRIIRLTPEIVNQDIQKIVNDGMDKLQKRLRLKKEVKDRLWGILVDRSEGMFLWVLLAMKQLDRARFVTAQKLEKLIQALPNGLNGIYDRMLEGLETNISDPDDLSLIRKMIGWVVLAQRPLTVAEFKVAIAIELDSDSMDSIEVMLYISREIRNLCGSFLEIVSEQTPRIIVSNLNHDNPEEDDHYEDPAATVRLIHQSAKDYFFDREKRLSSPLSKFRIHEKSGHNEIASMCLTYLLFKDFGTGSLKSDLSMSGRSLPIGKGEDDTALRKLIEQRVADYPFLKYAVIAWGYHVQSSVEGIGQENTINPAVMKVACQFLEKPRYLEYWFQLYTFLENSEAHHSQKVNALHVACLMNLPIIATYILNNWNIDINECSDEGKTALLFAVHATLDSTDSQTLRIVLGSNPDLNVRDKNGNSALIIAAGYGDQLSTVGMLLDAGADIEIRKEGSFTALHMASIYGHTETVELLLSRRADIESKAEKSWNSLLLASISGHEDTVKLLLDKGANIETKQTQGYTALHLACCYNEYKETTKLLLDRGADIESKDNGGHAPLLLAASYGNKETVELLLGRGADIESKAEKSWNSLLLASINGHEDTVKLLLDKGANIETKQTQGRTALHLACSYNEYKETARLLLDRGADIESKDKEGYTPLLLAASYGNKETVELLLGRGANIESKTEHSWAPLLVACINGHEETVELLLEMGVDVESNTDCAWSPLHAASTGGHTRAVRLLLDRGANIEFKQSESWTALQMASLQGHTETVMLLLDRGAEIESGQDGSRTSLHHACSNGHKETARLLLVKGADIESKDHDALTALIVASLYGHTETVELLLDRGADIESKDHDASTALIVASLYGHTETAKLLLDRGADIESKQGGRIPLHFAVESGRREMAELLLDRGADTGRIGLEGQTALHIAAGNGDEVMTKLLLSRGVAVGSGCDNNWTPCHVAALWNYINVLRLFADHGDGILVDAGDRCGGLLQNAVLSGNIDIVEFILNLGTGTSAASSRGCTALHTAASEGGIDIFNALLEHKEDPHQVDSNGWSPIICAWRNRRQAVIERLLELGCTLPDPNHISTCVPTCWSDVDKSALLLLSKDKLCIQIPDIILHEVLSVKSDYCWPAERDFSYFEVEIVKNTGIIGIGLSRAFTPRTTYPGWLKGTIGYHGDDGGIIVNGQTCQSLETFTAGDTIGFGVNFDQLTAFFTKNGRFLASTVQEVISGQLYPTITFGGPNVEVNTNFGQRPFLFQDFEKAAAQNVDKLDKDVI